MKKNKDRRHREVPRNPATLVIEADVLRCIRQHAHSSPKSEICGVLIGREQSEGVVVSASIPGQKATQAGTHVTFTQETWAHIYKVKDADYPDDRIVGWYHSHPGFGVFLSDHDTFIHQNFFSAAFQIAWVYDPQTEEEGCFHWEAGKIVKLSEFSIRDRSPLSAGVGTVAEPRTLEDVQPDPLKDQADATHRSRVRWATSILSHAAVLVLGFALAVLLLPPRLVIVGDPNAISPTESMPNAHSRAPADPSSRDAEHSPESRPNPRRTSPASTPAKDSNRPEAKDNNGKQ